MKQSSNRSDKIAVGSLSSMCVKCKRMFTLLIVVVAFCTSGTVSTPTPQEQQPQAATIRVQQCREGCLEKFLAKSLQCQQNAECSTCLDECSKTPPSKVAKSIRGTWSLHTASMIQQDSLVLVDVAWKQLSMSSQCLVTWEVSGGGLMGNLLTESFNVQLSLWPETKYRVQVTCKNKLSGVMSRSLPLTIDTSEAIKAIDTPTSKIRPIASKQTIAPFIRHIPISAVTATVLPMPTQPPVDEDDYDVDTDVFPYQIGTKTLRTDFLFGSSYTKNSDVAIIEPIRRGENNLLALLNRVHRPLLFGMTAGITLLMLLLLFFVRPFHCSLRTCDKTMLLAEDLNVHSLTRPPALMVPNTQDQGGMCKSPASCSRHTLRV